MLKFFGKRKGERGFTLIELLVVIAIIGILATIVLVSLNTARQKARDSRRISDLRQIALALEMYYDDNGGYPSDTTANDDDWGNPATANTLVYELQGEGGGTVYMASVPSDPGSNTYYYHPSGSTANGAQDYVLAATLENSSHSALDDDVDGTVYGRNCDGSVYCIQP
jgi:type II secretion system protein G